MTSSGTASDAGISDPASAGLKYEVFLSFRGPDTRKSFTDHLYETLNATGIRVYKDDEDLRVGEEIGEELLKAIEQSEIAIPILSKDYATSKWCLNELVKIMECKGQKRLKVMPLFYYVSPSEIRDLTGSYEKAFLLHGDRQDDKTIREWKGALREVGNLKGWHLKSDTNGEGKVVEDITTAVLRELKKGYLFEPEYLVGLEEHVEEILSMIDAEENGVKVLGIYGMGGIGKTTLARVIYNRLLDHQFESYSFVADIRENSRTATRFIQKKLILDILGKKSADIIGTDDDFFTIRQRLLDRKVLILLDDVDEVFQIKWLIDSREYFAWGSIIIITTRDSGILETVGADLYHDHPVLNSDHARQLFVKHAFQSHKPPEDHAELLKKAVQISGGLPLSLEVIGSSLRNKSKESWENELKKLEKVPPKNVRRTLEISFEALDGREKQILLDIACFFIGVDHRMAIHFWDSGLYPKHAIMVLRKMSLIKIGADNLIWMHDQIRDFCRDYIYEGLIKEPEKPRILWNQEEAAKIFERKMQVAESVQGLFLEFDKQSQSLSSAKNFAKLPNLKFLQVKSHDISQAISFGRCLETIAWLFNLLWRSQLALTELRWFFWHHFHPMYKLCNFSLRNLVFLNLSESSISDGWDCWSQIKKS